MQKYILYLNTVRHSLTTYILEKNTKDMFSAYLFGPPLKSSKSSSNKTTSSANINIFLGKLSFTF